MRPKSLAQRFLWLFSSLFTLNLWVLKSREKIVNFPAVTLGSQVWDRSAGHNLHFEKVKLTSFLWF